MSDTILMCAPDYFDVSYVINPWMEGNLSKAKKENAIKQWSNLHKIISSHAKVVLISPSSTQPDLVFTANAGLVFKNKVILSNFFYQERKGEEILFEEYFKNNGFSILHLPKEISFEGAGDALYDRKEKILWAGHGFRTNFSAHEYLSKMQEFEVVSLKLIDPRFYHLDTCLCPLELGHLLYYPGAFDEKSNFLIKEKLPSDRLINISDDDALHFACNAVSIENKVILNNCSNELMGRLNKLGYNVIKTELTEFLKSGGAAKCLTLRLN